MFERLVGFLLALAAPVVMLFVAVLSIPDYLRLRRLKRMSGD
jgi:hypothetical protein